MSFEQQIPERDRNVRLYSNRGEVVVRGERRGERLADQTGKVSTWLLGRLLWLHSKLRTKYHFFHYTCFHRMYKSVHCAVYSVSQKVIPP